MACAERQALESADGAQAWLTDNGARLQLSHGPIDLIIEATGQHAEVQRSYQQAAVAFESILATLASQLPRLRQVTHSEDEDASFQGKVAQRMHQAIQPFRQFCVTPMIAVAGAVADHVMSCMLQDCNLQRVMINNGGDIALYLSAGTEARVGIFSTPAHTRHYDILTVRHEHRIGGIATSGWQGRSYSLGIADAVTVLSRNAASADVAATLIANAVDLPGSPLVVRTPANQLDPDSDLRHTPVTVQVGRLSDVDVSLALRAGARRAHDFHQRGLVNSVYLHLQGQTTLVGASPHLPINPLSCVS